jgi:glycosyltransferase involved in cell wall biosynthesis
MSIDANVTGAPVDTNGSGPVARAGGVRSVAVVHDYLNQRGGAERVALAIAQMWPRAPIYTSIYRPGSTFPGFRAHEVRATALDRVPVDAGFRNLFPFYPTAFHMLGEIDADVVIASSSGWAHMARARPGAVHVVYCHTPARWLYGSEYLGANGRRSVRQTLATPLMGAFRRADRTAARRADVYIANSEYVRRRIGQTYGIDAEVVPPPVDTDRFRPTPRGKRLLVVSRLMPYKHVDLIVGAATRAGIPLDVVGDGPQLQSLRRSAGPTVAFHGGLADDAVVELVQRCNAVCVAAEEDFGIVAVEAQAAGKPVVAYARGGSLETVADGITGAFFHERTVESVVAAFAAVERLETPPGEIAAHAQPYSRGSFERAMRRIVELRLDGVADLHPATGAPRGDDPRA